MPEQLGLPLLTSDWTLPQSLPELNEPIAIDLETCDPHLKELGPGWCFPSHHKAGHVIGICVATKDNQWYFPIRHEEGPNMDEQEVLRWAKVQFAKDTPKIFANASYDLGWLLREGITVNGELHDIQVAAPLLNENRKSYALDSLAEDVLGIGKDETLLKQAAAQYGVDPKADMYRLPAKFVGPYGEADARKTFDIWLKAMPLIERFSLEEVYQLEMDIVPYLIQMRNLGVRVDIDRAHEVKGIFQAKELAALREIHNITGLNVDVWSAKSVAKAFDNAGIKYNRTSTGKPSFTQQWLEQNRDPLSTAITTARKYQKAYSTFVQNFIMDRERDGRIHCQFHSLRQDKFGTRSGRFSSSGPNLQQIPARDPEVGPMVRSIFLPEEGERWASLDYSKQEPRLTIHFAYERGLDGAAELVQKFKDDPETDPYQVIADATGQDYKTSKQISLGRTYGMGLKRLCEQLELDLQEGEEVLRRFDLSVPFIGQLTQMCKNEARTEGFVRTIMGRRAHVKETPHKALNRKVQGSAADQAKLALRQMGSEGLIPRLTVHDEYCTSYSNEADIKRIQEIMETCLKLAVPTKVSCSTGTNWGELS